MYAATTYSLQATLLPHNGNTGDKFGYAVTTCGTASDMIIVSAVKPDAIGINFSLLRLLVFGLFTASLDIS